MGNTWAVEIWGQWEPNAFYRWNRVYGGESMFGALRTFWRYRKSRFGCIKIEYRPSPTGTGEGI